MAFSPLPPIPPEIAVIVAAYLACKTKQEITDYRATLTPEQLASLDAWIKLLATDRKEKPPKNKADLLKDFNDWSAGRTGLTQQELIDNYIFTHDMTPEDEKKLRDLVAKEDAAKQEEEKKKKEQEQPPEKKPIPPELVIKPTPYPKWWKQEGVAPIDFTSPGGQFVVTAKADLELYISTIAITVDGETNVVFTFGTAGASGAMDLGGDGEPKGMVIAGGNSPITCGNASLQIQATSTDTVHVGGFVAYYLWKKDQPPPGPQR